MIRILLLSLVLCFSAFASPVESYFSQKLLRAQPGDYIVAKEPGSYCLLILRAKEGNRIVLEEIDIPEYAVDLAKIDWKTWVLSKAPGHSSWGMLSLDLEKKELLEAYSVTKRCFLNLSKEEQFFLQLLSLPTTRLKDHERRKIGPPPLADEQDRRANWQPKIKFEGEIRKDPTNVYRAFWPKDGSLLSNCSIDFFFDEKIPDFPFPIWIEVYTGHFKARLAVLEAGRGLISPVRDMPKRPPKILQVARKEDGTLVVKIECHEKFEAFDLFALQASGPLIPGISLPHEVQWSNDKVAILLISKEVAEKRLLPGHRYRLSIRPSGHPDSYFETDISYLLIDKTSH